VTIEVVDADGQVLANGRFDTSSSGVQLMSGNVAQWRHRRWAVEGANGMGRPMRAVAMVALRTSRLNELTYDEELVASRLLTDRRDELSHLRVQTVNRLQRLMTELIPGGAKRDLGDQPEAGAGAELLAELDPRQGHPDGAPTPAGETFSSAIAVMSPFLVAGRWR
jgi:hypothetical protein